MEYFQDVVSEYLRANRATFIDTECCIQLNSGNPDYCSKATRGGEMPRPAITALENVVPWKHPSRDRKVAKTPV